MSYFDSAISTDGRKAMVNLAIHDLTPKLDAFDAILVRGMSGVAGGSLIAYMLDKPLCILRKQSDTQTHGGRFECPSGYYDKVDRLLFVDDFCSTGKTVESVIEDLKAHDAMPGMWYSHKHRIVAAYFYQSGWDRPDKQTCPLPVWSGNK